MPHTAKSKDPKIAMFRELRNLNNATSAISVRAIGTPFESRAKQIAQLSGSMMQDFQHDPEAMIDTLDDHDLDPLMLLIGHIVAADFSEVQS